MARVTEPDIALTESPVCKSIEPDTPFIPALSVCAWIPPDIKNSDFPDNIFKDPPVSETAFPESIDTSPPTPASPVPAAIITPPAESIAFPLFIAILPDVLERGPAIPV